VDNWAKLISSVRLKDRCLINHKSATGNKPLIETRINRLYELADILNQAVPDSIIKESLDVDNRQDVLNRMHVHFPNIHNDPKLHKFDKFATEYNDIIHWLENEFRCNDSSRFKIFLDFNKSGCEFYDIDPRDYKWFTPFINFGDISLHYTHVGRHARELFNARDLVCPKDQFVPQSKYSVSCVLWFMNNVFDDADFKKQYITDWEKFYEDRGGEQFFGYEITDPNLRFGYIKLGQLEKIIINQKEVGFSTLDEINLVRHHLLNENLTKLKIDGIVVL
jgi:hypothetical protein